MPLLRELGAAVRQRRREIGLSQKELAEVVDLSRATLTNLENGKLNDLSSKRLERLANELGFAVGLVGTRRERNVDAFTLAAQIASVPYSSKLPASVLLESLREGVVPPGYIPHMRTFLQEAPVAVLADVVDEMLNRYEIPKSDTWKRMRTLAGVLKCNRPLWRSKQI